MNDDYEEAASRYPYWIADPEDTEPGNYSSLDASVQNAEADEYRSAFVNGARWQRKQYGIGYSAGSWQERSVSFRVVDADGRTIGEYADRQQAVSVVNSMISNTMGDNDADQCHGLSIIRLSALVTCTHERLNADEIDGTGTSRDDESVSDGQVGTGNQEESIDRDAVNDDEIRGLVKLMHDKSVYYERLSRLEDEYENEQRQRDHDRKVIMMYKHDLEVKHDQREYEAYVKVASDSTMMLEKLASL